MATGAQESKGAAEKEGKHLRLHCQVGDEAACGEWLSLVETAWDMEQQVLPGGPADAGDLHDLHLYSSIRNYEAAEEKLTGGAFKSNLGFSHFESKSAHIALQPPLSPKALDKFGLPLLTARLMAHETAHVARYSTLPNHASHPRWLADGTASRAEELALKQHQLISNAEADPYFSTHIVDVQKMAKEGKLPRAADILRDKVETPSSRSMYGLRWLWLRFLCDKAPDAWKKIADEARRMGGGSQYAENLAVAVEAALKTSLPNLDTAFANYVAQLKPDWEEVYRTMALEGSIWKQAAFGESNAIAWRTGSAGESAYTVTGQLQILSGTKQQMNLLLGRSPAGFVSVAFVAGYGVTVFHYDAGANQWNKIGDRKIGDVAVGKWFDFQIEVKQGRMYVRINDAESLEVGLPSHPMDGPWGVGAQAGSCGLWNEVELK